MERPLIVFNIAGTPARGVNASLAHKRSPRRMPGAFCMTGVALAVLVGLFVEDLIV